MEYCPNKKGIRAPMQFMVCNVMVLRKIVFGCSNRHGKK